MSWFTTRRTALRLQGGLQRARRGGRGRGGVARQARRRSAAEQGYSLIELLVTMLMMVVVMAAILNLLDSSSRAGQADLARNAGINDVSLGYSRMVDEIRQAYAIDCPSGGCSGVSSSSAIDFLERTVNPTQTDERVTYNCAIPQPGVSGEDECVRYQAAASDSSDAVPLGPSCVSDGDCTATVVIQNVVNPGGAPVFSNLTTGTGASGVTRWVSGTATVYVPSNGTLSSNVSPYRHDLILQQSFSIPQLLFGQ